MYILRKSSKLYEFFINDELVSSGSFKKISKKLNEVVKLLPPSPLYDEQGNIVAYV